MYKKIDDTTHVALLEAGIQEFSLHGLDRANMSSIARSARLSVGVIYKYYEDKDTFFLTCVRHSLKLMDEVLQQSIHPNDSTSKNIRNLVLAMLEVSRTHPTYNAMYCEITSGGCRKYADKLAIEIESETAALYRSIFQNLLPQKEYYPSLIAFFFDNLLMMLQFSVSCDYYKKRMNIYFSENSAPSDEQIADVLVKLMEPFIKEA